jgi:hypothetical protein
MQGEFPIFKILSVIVQFRLVLACPDATQDVPNKCPVMGFILVTP